MKSQKKFQKNLILSLKHLEEELNYFKKIEHVEILRQKLQEQECIEKKEISKI